MYQQVTTAGTCVFIIAKVFLFSVSFLFVACHLCFGLYIERCSVEWRVTCDSGRVGGTISWRTLYSLRRWLLRGWRRGCWTSRCCHGNAGLILQVSSLNCTYERWTLSCRHGYLLYIVEAYRQLVRHRPQSWQRSRPHSTAPSEFFSIPPSRDGTSLCHYIYYSNLATLERFAF